MRDYSAHSAVLPFRLSSHYIGPPTQRNIASNSLVDIRTNCTSHPVRFGAIREFLPGLARSIETRSLGNRPLVNARGNRVIDFTHLPEYRDSLSRSCLRPIFSFVEEVDRSGRSKYLQHWLKRSLEDQLNGMSLPNDRQRSSSFTDQFVRLVEILNQRHFGNNYEVFAAVSSFVGKQSHKLLSHFSVWEFMRCVVALDGMGWDMSSVIPNIISALVNFRKLHEAIELSDTIYHDFLKPATRRALRNARVYRPRSRGASSMAPEVEMGPYQPDRFRYIPARTPCGPALGTYLPHLPPQLHSRQHTNRPTRLLPGRGYESDTNLVFGPHTPFSRGSYGNRLLDLPEYVDGLGDEHDDDNDDGDDDDDDDRITLIDPARYRNRRYSAPTTFNLRGGPMVDEQTRRVHSAYSRPNSHGYFASGREINYDDNEYRSPDSTHGHRRRNALGSWNTQRFIG
ncbi:MAG: hypothetical protein M1837_007545 [Sclerophora amabilis]|nr:MAG: hypothetical protein M1837_007545 [Sclerophora amabilis]